MKLIKGLLILIIFTLAGGALADIVPSPRFRVLKGKPGPKRIIPHSLFETKVKMESAVVDIRITQVDAVDYLPHKKGKAALAEVSCIFNMTSLNDLPEGVIEFGFPFSSDGGSSPRIHSFSAEANGFRCGNPRGESWTVPSREGETTYQGYSLKADIRKSKNIKIKVSYEAVLLPEQGSRTTFEYILCSGALWAGPIGSETVRIVAAEPLTMEVLAPKGISAEKKSEREFLWALKNMEPDEDIRISLTLGQAKSD